MTKITKEQYEFALARVEELLPLVDDSTPANDKSMVELSVMSDIVIAYEKEHFPIEKPTVAELIELSLEEKGMTQKQLASEIGVSPSRVNDYISGRSEPTLKIARLLCGYSIYTPLPCWDFENSQNIIVSEIYLFNVPLKQNTSVPQSISGKTNPGANSPNTDEPEPLMDA